MESEVRTFEPISIGALLHPRKRLGMLELSFALGVGLGALFMILFDAPLWLATTIVLEAIAGPLALKWFDDRTAFGGRVMVLSILIVVQGFHAIEHIVQWTQNHLLGMTPRQSGGLISPLNAEIVHFTWNWLVLVTVAYLMFTGMRNRWAWALLIWTCAHTLEHTYLFSKYLGVGNGAQGLPGIIGKGGWLAVNAATSGPAAFICDLAPPIATATRLDVHFWWNFGETVLLALAARAALRRGELVPAPRRPEA